MSNQYTELIPLRKYWETYSVPDEVLKESLPKGIEDFFKTQINEIKRKYIEDINKGKGNLTDAQLVFFSKNVEVRIIKYREVKFLDNTIQIRLFFKVTPEFKEDYYNFLKRFIGWFILKLEDILNLKSKIRELEDLIPVFERDYLRQLDDDLWTIDLPSEPYFTEDYDVVISTETKLTKKFLVRFCEDYGLSLKSFEDKPEENRYVYIFEKQKDILKSLEIL